MPPNELTQDGEPKRIDRRRFLQVAGIGVGGLTLTCVGGKAAAQTSCVDGPFERAFEAETINISKLANRRVSHKESNDPLTAAKQAMEKAPVDHGFDATSRTSGAQVPPSSKNLLTTGVEYDGLQDIALIEPPLQDPPIVAPSDSQIATGRSKTMQAVNRKIAIFNQRSGIVEVAVSFERFFDPLITEAGFVTGRPVLADPRLRYDPIADRFVLSIFYMHFATWSGSWLLAVSDDSNPNGLWNLYRIPTFSGDWPDYARLGLDRDAVYLTASTTPQSFDFPDDYDEEVAILDKAAVYDGAKVSTNYFTGLLQSGPSRYLDFIVQPAFQPHSGGERGSYHLLNTQFPENRITLWEVTNPITDPSLHCSSIDVDPFSSAPPARQPDTDARIDIDSYQLMNVDYNDGSLWTAHTIGYDWEDGSGPVAAIRWYEIDPTSTEVIQKGTFGQPETSYFHPHIKSDGDRTLIVHDFSGSQYYPGIKVAGRTADYTRGKIEDSLVVQKGESPMEHPTNFGRRDPVWWQDYTGVSVNPSTGNFWVTAQYSPDFDVSSDSDQPDRYQTRIAEVSFDGMGGNG